ncbi:MAG: cytochrome C [Alphaproteobacteria bacterium]|nr:cytochrome C [Alphaproteobacteria bacterium]MCW5740384.1 cytochrome C [Alphaproteobacteria bacterium]
MGLVLIGLSGGALAASPDGPFGAMSCSGCHAISTGVDTAVPRLFGRPAAEIAAAMRDFQKGERTPTVMGRIAKGYTDAEIDALAAWFAQHKDAP